MSNLSIFLDAGQSTSWIVESMLTMILETVENVEGWPERCFWHFKVYFYYVLGERTCITDHWAAVCADVTFQIQHGVHYTKLVGLILVSRSRLWPGLTETKKSMSQYMIGSKSTGRHICKSMLDNQNVLSHTIFYLVVVSYFIMEELTLLSLPVVLMPQQKQLCCHLMMVLLGKYKFQVG